MEIKKRASKRKIKKLKKSKMVRMDTELGLIEKKRLKQRCRRATDEVGYSIINLKHEIIKFERGKKLYVYYRTVLSNTFKCIIILLGFS